MKVHETEYLLMLFVCVVAGEQLEITDLMTKVKSEYMPNVKDRY